MRRLRSDLVEVCTIMQNFESLNSEVFPPLRSAGREVISRPKHYSPIYTRKYFPQMVVDQGNRLRTVTVCAEIVNMFKKQIDQMPWQHGVL